jgi:hypothetical protein
VVCSSESLLRFIVQQFRPSSTFFGILRQINAGPGRLWLISRSQPARLRPPGIMEE